MIPLRPFRWLVASIVATSAMPMAAAADTTLAARCPGALTPYTAVYTSSYRGVGMRGKRELELLADGAYRLSHGASFFASSMDEQSRFRIDDEQILVDRYDMTRSILGVKREYHTDYDWGQKLATVTGREQATLPLDDRPLDLLSYQVALQCDLEQGKRDLSYTVIARTGIKTYRYEIRGRETLSTPLGDIETLVADRIREDDDRTTRIWVAPSLNYLLVRLHQYEARDDASYELDLEKVTFRDPPPIDATTPKSEDTEGR